MRDKEISEGLGELADVAERDHEVQMARAELYKLAKYAIKLHDMLKGVSEAEGLEGWVQSKITKSADMIGSVYHHMDYDESPMSEEPMGEVTESEKRWKQTSMSPEEATKKYGKENVKVKKGGLRNGDDMVEVLEATVEEGKYKNDAQRKAVHASKAKKGYKESLQDKLSAKLAEDKCCSECGNPSYKSVSEEKKKGSHGKVCWKGYRRGEGNSCHKVKGDG